ncbi:hypothetical protein [Acetobacter conturbans]|uniref:hypothetical protein n=1 Tax=Acetobacter conturbans TaxID=1737472 RepID=UPI001568BDF5|nr:hypothetical protein [Acetobacter conturbans]
MSGTSAQDKAYPEDDGRIIVNLDGQSHTLNVNNQPLRRFYPGWAPFALHVSLLPNPVLRLRHDDGLEAFWIFDRTFNYRASRFEDLTPEEQDTLVDSVAPYFRTLVTTALEALRPGEVPLTEKVRNLGRILCENLLSAWLQRFPPPGCFTAAMLPAEGLSFRPDTPPLKAAALTQLLSIAKGLAAKSTPVVLSPYGGAVLRGYTVLRLRDMELTRFADPHANIVLYVGTVHPADDAEISVIYCPQQDIILMERQNDVAELIPLRLLSRFIGDARYVEEAPQELTIEFGQAGSPGGFTLGAASSLPGSLPTLPGNWNGQQNNGANAGSQSLSPLSPNAFGVPAIQAQIGQKRGPEEE